jgi:hypothetical protein
LHVRERVESLANFLVNTKRNIDLRDLEDQNHQKEKNSRDVREYRL